MRLLLDTVAFIWAVTSADRISNKAMAALRSEATIREISVVSLSEVAIKQSIGKLRIGKDEVLTGIADLRLRVLPYTADHALHLFDLPLHHSDPFDRPSVRTGAPTSPRTPLHRRRLLKTESKLPMPVNRRCRPYLRRPSPLRN